MPNRSLARLAFLALPAGTLLGLVAVLLRGPFFDPAASPAQFAAAVTGANPLGALLALPSILLQSLSFIVFAGYFSQGPAARPAWWGLLLSLLGGALTLVLLGVFIFVFPAVGRLYQAGQLGVLQVAVAASGGLFLPVALLGGLASTLGAALFGLAFARQPGVPKWAALLSVLSVPLFYFAPPVPYVPEIIGFALFLVANCAIVLPLLSGRAQAGG